MFISGREYNPCTGQFSKNGKPIGWVRPADGYVFVSLGKGLLYLAHRVAWKWTYGKWPTEIDHIDGNTSNNSIWNLVDATHQDNLLNQERHRKGKPRGRRRDYMKRPRRMPHIY